MVQSVQPDLIWVRKMHRGINFTSIFHFSLRVNLFTSKILTCPSREQVPITSKLMRKDIQMLVMARLSYFAGNTNPSTLSPCAAVLARLWEKQANYNYMQATLLYFSSRNVGNTDGFVSGASCNKISSCIKSIAVNWSFMESMPCLFQRNYTNWLFFISYLWYYERILLSLDSKFLTCSLLRLRRFVCHQVWNRHMSHLQCVPGKRSETLRYCRSKARRYCLMIQPLWRFLCYAIQGTNQARF